MASAVYEPPGTSRQHGWDGGPIGKVVLGHQRVSCGGCIRHAEDLRVGWRL